MKKQLLAITLVLSHFVHAQIVRTPVNSVYTNLTAYSHQFSDAFSFTANQGALPGMQKFSVGLYSEKRFLLNELSSYSAAVVLPTSSGNLGVKADYFGQQVYNESSLGLAYGRNLGSKVALGIQFNYFSLKAAGYGSSSTINFDAGVLFHLTAQMNAGLHVHNPVAATWGKYGDEKLPAMYSFGLGYDASPQFYFGVEAEKIEDQPIGINAGLHYNIVHKVIARAGIHSATSVYYFGLGVQVKNLRFDVTASLHPYLGVTPGLLLLYSQQE